jgi:methionine aminotransferase
MIYSKVKRNNNEFFSSFNELVNSHHPINLSEGYTSFKCSPHLIELVEKYLHESLNQYTHSFGLLRLREKIAHQLETLYGKVYNPESEITITTGKTQSIYATITALVRDGDQVVVFEPVAGNYVQAIELNGGEPVYVRLKEPDFAIDWEDLQKVINGKTRMIVINSPHNPTGWVMSELDMIRLQRIIAGTNIIVLIEETFRHIVFDDGGHQSMASFPKLAEQSVVIAALGETYHVTGWQVGFCAAPKEIMKEIRAIQQMVIHSVTSPMQEAFADFLDIKDEYMSVGKFYQNKRDLFNRCLDQSKYKPVLSKGTFFELLNYSQLSKLTDRDFTFKLIQDSGIAALPLSIFYHEKPKYQMLRFNIAQPDEVLEQVAERLNRVEG